MKLEDVTQVKTTIDQEVANQLLAKGYKILKILSTKKASTDGFAEEVLPMFVLGLVKKVEHDS